MLQRENIFHISAPKHSKTTGMLQGLCLSSQTHLMEVLQREQARWNSLLKALSSFFGCWDCPDGGSAPAAPSLSACGTPSRSFQGAAGLGSAWCPGFLLCRGCWVGVLLLVPFRYLNCTYFPSSFSPHINFLSACCTPAQSKEDSTFWFVIKVFLKISWRDPLAFLPTKIKSRNHVCLFVLFSAVNYFCLFTLL